MKVQGRRYILACFVHWDNPWEPAFVIRTVPCNATYLPTYLPTRDICTCFRFGSRLLVDAYGDNVSAPVGVSIWTQTSARSKRTPLRNGLVFHHNLKIKLSLKLRYMLRINRPAKKTEEFQSKRMEPNMSQICHQSFASGRYYSLHSCALHRF
jgi:hypothetical protein